MLNCSKSCEVIFTDSRHRRRCVAEPTMLSGIMCSHSLKMLVVDIGNDFSISQHVQRLVMMSAQTICMLCVLWSHGLIDAALQHVYWDTVVVRLMYAVSAWCGFTRASDRQHIDSVVDRACHYRYCALILPSFNELCDATDDEFISKAVHLSNHFLHALLPHLSSASEHYNMQAHTHSFKLPEHSTYLSD